MDNASQTTERANAVRGVAGSSHSYARTRKHSIRGERIHVRQQFLAPPARPCTAGEHQCLRLCIALETTRHVQVAKELGESSVCLPEGAVGNARGPAAACHLFQTDHPKLRKYP